MSNENFPTPEEQPKKPTVEHTEQKISEDYEAYKKNVSLLEQGGYAAQEAKDSLINNYDVDLHMHPWIIKYFKGLSTEQFSDLHKNIFSQTGLYDLTKLQHEGKIEDTIQIFNKYLNDPLGKLKEDSKNRLITAIIGVN